MLDSIKEEDLLFENEIFLEGNFLYFKSSIYKLDTLISVSFTSVNVEKKYVGRSKFPLIKFFVVLTFFVFVNNFFENGVNDFFVNIFHDLGLSEALIKNIVDFVEYYKSILFISLLILMYSILSMIVGNFFSKENYSYNDEENVIKFLFHNGSVLVFSGEDDLLIGALPLIKSFLVESQKTKKSILLFREYQ